MAKQERAIRTRRAILEAAAAVFDECGYDAATITEILERADVTKGALYFHFGSKEELARGILEEQVLFGAVQPQACKLQELVDVTMVVAHRLSYDTLLRGSIRLTIEQGVHDLHSRRQPYLDWMELSARLLEEAKRNGELLPHVVPADTAALVVGSFAGIQVMSQTLTKRGDLKQRVAVFWDHVLPSITVPGVLRSLDTAPDRAARIAASAEGAGGGVERRDADVTTG